MGFDVDYKLVNVRTSSTLIHAYYVHTLPRIRHSICNVISIHLYLVVFVVVVLSMQLNLREHQNDYLWICECACVCVEYEEK